MKFTHYILCTQSPGQGHSLKAAEDRMPVDLACATRRPQARGFRDLCVPGHHEDSITEETGDQMESESSEGQSCWMASIVFFKI